MSEQKISPDDIKFRDETFKEAEQEFIRYKQGDHDPLKPDPILSLLTTLSMITQDHINIYLREKKEQAFNARARKNKSSGARPLGGTRPNWMEGSNDWFGKHDADED